MSTTVQTRLKLRNDSEENFNKVSSTLVPLAGEVLIVRTADYGVRLKVGNGTSAYADLNFLDNDADTKMNIVRGYYKDGKFYARSTYDIELNLSSSQLYMDVSTNKFYIYNTKLEEILTIPTATTSTPGVVKLYSTHGTNTDGAVDQNTFTSAVNNIYLDTEENDDDAYTLFLHKPW